MKDKEFFKSLIKTFPITPGVYLMKDKNENIIYIGKAKKLKNRVSSYFGSSIDQSSKVGKMVSKIDNIDYIVTNNELEALVLESNLIKKHRPLYNILLKDDKGYKFIRISPPPYSRITVVRKKQDDGSIYFGPYMSSFMANQIVEAVCHIFKLPTCKRSFINRERYKRPCLDHYIDLCAAPCRGLISQEEYQENVERAVKYLRSGMGVIIKELESKMKQASRNLNFESAAKIRDQIKAIKQVNIGADVIISEYKDIDVLAAISDDRYICATLLIFRDYKLIDKKQYLLDNDEELQNVRKTIILEQYSESSSKPQVLYLDDFPCDLELLKDYVLKDIEVILSSEKKINNILEIAKNNSKERILQELKLIDKDVVSLNKLKNLLNLKTLPRRIEAYDISNFGSEIIVGAMIVFVDGRAKKSLYRKFKIKNVLIQDDYKSIEEMVDRRIKRFLNTEKSDESFSHLPDLFLIDGGKGQVDVVMSVLKRYGLSIPVYGMLKDGSHTTDSLLDSLHKKINIKQDKDIFLFIKRIQDEVHRFAINYSRKTHDKI